MKKTTPRRLPALLLALLLLTALVMSLGACSAQAASAENDAIGATCFTFSDSGISVTEGDADSYKTEGTALTINGAGTYVVQGKCADGSITVKKGTTGVTLVLNGLDLTSQDTAPITCNKSTQVTIVAAEGTVNELTDSEYNNDDNYPDNENAENAVIKTKDGSQVTLSGSGTINVYAYGKNGIKGGATTEEEGEARLNVEELTLNIYAYVNDGLKSDQELNILSGTVNVEAADDGIKSDLVLNIGREGTDGPTINVNQSYEGIEAATINIYSGTVSVTADDDGVNAANSDLAGYSFACNIYGGRLYINAISGDGIDSNGSLNIADGTVIVFAAQANSDNSPLDSETGFTLGGGTVLAVGSGQMAETPRSAEQPYIYFGSAGFGGRGGRPSDMGERPSDMGGTPPDMGGTPPDMGGRPSDMGGQPGQMNGQPGGTGGSGLTVAAGDTIAILDAQGNTICSETALRSADYIFFSSAELTAGETYTLTVNGETYGMSRDHEGSFSSTSDHKIRCGN